MTDEILELNFLCDCCLDDWHEKTEGCLTSRLKIVTAKSVHAFHAALAKKLSEELDGYETRNSWKLSPNEAALLDAAWKA
ncbi:MAG: hypothetical protein Q8R15_00725 [Candidatus Micrarchaeota archaeon]|nr:hypothetical protein [Candidatus Micrarchaeota archaeon]